MRYKGAKGGRASGKSHNFAEDAVEAMVCNPSLRVVCIREIQVSLKFSVKALVEAKIRKLGVSVLFVILDTEIRRRGGSGVMIFQGMQDHTADSIKSLEGFGIAWVEEAQSLSPLSLKLLLPTIRLDGSEIWFSWNPKHRTDAVEVFFASNPPKSICIHVTYKDNPFCPETMRDEAARSLANDPDEYEHVWLGGFDMGGGGRVYSSFSGRIFPYGNVDPTVCDNGGSIYVGQDFNVNPMASTIGIRAVDEFHVIRALQTPTSNTAELCVELKRLYPGRHIIVCPDPAGNQRSTKTSVVGQTDITILQDAGFDVRFPPGHAAVVDRINNANKMYFDLDTGRRRTRIHPDAASALIEGLQGFMYKEGTSIPNKTTGTSKLYSHICESADYVLWQEFNVLVEAGDYGSSTWDFGSDN